MLLDFGVELRFARNVAAVPVDGGDVRFTCDASDDLPRIAATKRERNAMLREIAGEIAQRSCEPPSPCRARSSQTFGFLENLKRDDRRARLRRSVKRRVVGNAEIVPEPDEGGAGAHA